jgi:hypothetical protein
MRFRGDAAHAGETATERHPPLVHSAAGPGEYDPQAMAAASTPQAERESGDGGACLIGISRSLHAELMLAARRERVSLNALVARTLATAVEESARANPAPARWTKLALAANFAIVALAAIVGIVLLILAWTHGS